VLQTRSDDIGCTSSYVNRLGLDNGSSLVVKPSQLVRAEGLSQSHTRIGVKSHMEVGIDFVSTRLVKGRLTWRV
jgi:hypothetical protein